MLKIRDNLRYILLITHMKLVFSGTWKHATDGDSSLPRSKYLVISVVVRRWPLRLRWLVMEEGGHGRSVKQRGLP